MNKQHDIDITETTNQVQMQRRAERACAQLLGLINGVTADGHLHDLEIQFLRTWLASEGDAVNHWLGRSIASHIDSVLADSEVTDAERTWLLETLQAATGSYFSQTGSVTAETTDAFPTDDGPVQFANKVFCLTGKFLYGSRAKCAEDTEAAGGICANSVTRSTHYLVIGSAGATTSWKHASYGAKIDAAMKLKEKGHPIIILKEESWSAALSR